MNLRQKQCAGSGMNCALLALAELSLLLFLSLQLLLSLPILLVQSRYQREQKLPSLLSPPKLPLRAVLPGGTERNIQHATSSCAPRGDYKLHL